MNEFTDVMRLLIFREKEFSIGAQNSERRAQVGTNTNGVYKIQRSGKSGCVVKTMLVAMDEAAL
jgi:hypothetical protein